ncbi:transmembrane and immunoglobulin domain-containing protein 1 isoform X2 [Nilaparvata lugens]|uniref:transmembrane and immunoglobulin domain-containing protein 1 isoform X2 n=1 Tax=Nilaparvata lugens TaxID=108931 RepID=UPI00193CDD14|nr:transmembrane and immunoglobulin domain-containing protein 1 isoform X2 [Nilaparvata lugens]
MIAFLLIQLIHLSTGATPETVDTIDLDLHQHLDVHTDMQVSEVERGGEGYEWDSHYAAQPYFDNSSRREVTTTVGQSAQLPCRVRNLGDRAVSWIRKRDLHILTVGVLTYTNDARFQSLHSEGSDEWTLKVTSTQLRDSGTYECQVSTEPKISLAFRLNVVVSRAKIVGSGELFVKRGSDINLTCIVVETVEPPSFIYWYRGGQLVNYSQRGGISVLTEKHSRSSRLLIARAESPDSGNYTCTPSASDSASVLVHVLNGEQPAAMQHDNSSSGAVARLLPTLLLLCQLVRDATMSFTYAIHR